MKSQRHSELLHSFMYDGELPMPSEDTENTRESIYVFGVLDSLKIDVPYTFHSWKYNKKDIAAPGICSSINQTHFKQTVIIPSDSADHEEATLTKMKVIGRAIPFLLEIATDFNNSAIQLKEQYNKTRDVELTTKFDELCLKTTNDLYEKCKKSCISEELVIHYTNTLERNVGRLGSDDSLIELLEDRSLFVECDKWIGISDYEVSNDEMLDDNTRPFVFIPGCGYINVNQVSVDGVIANKDMFSIPLKQKALSLQYIRRLGLLITVVGELHGYEEINDVRSAHLFDQYLHGGKSNKHILPDLSAITHEYIVYGIDVNDQDHEIFDELIRMFVFAVESELPENRSMAHDSELLRGLRTMYQEMENERLKFTTLGSRIANSLDWWSAILASRRGVRNRWDRILCNHTFSGKSSNYNNAVVIRTTIKDRTRLSSPEHESRHYFDLFLPGIQHTLDATLLTHSDQIQELSWDKIQMFFIINPSQMRVNKGKSGTYDVLLLVSSFQKI